MPPFTHLHVHSNYSLKEGAAYVSDLAATAAGMGMESLALTDHDGMYGAVRFTLACRGAGIRPILGAELEWGEGFHAVLLAENAAGWSNLCHLVTDMHLSQRAQTLAPGRRPRTSFEQIAERSEGLFALSGCEKGEVAWFASLGRTDEADEAARRWLDVFGTGHFAIELSNHLLDSDVLRNQKLMDLASDLGVKTVATNNTHYVTPEDAVLHECLDCMRRIVALTSRTSPRKNSEYWLKPVSAMAELLPEESIDNTAWVADLCRYELPMGEFHFPRLQTQNGESSTSVLARRCWSGLQKRFERITPELEERLQMELREIRRGGFCGYFVLVADIVHHAKHVMGIRCACRGSAAGSLVAYALEISDVDPVKYGLSFERFMNEYRVEIPDIDVDFESARRQDVNQYILDTYGERTAMVAMMDTFRARGALREVGKALGIHESEVDQIAKAFPHISARNIPEAIESLPEVAPLGLKASKLEALFDIASRIDAFPRHLAMHPSGVILSDERLADLMPMQRSFDGFLMSQYDKDDVEALGLAKLDVLGVRMFSTIAHTLSEIERSSRLKVDIDRIARDDLKTFELIRESRTLGCFQIESPGQRELLGKFQPDAFEDLIVDISLFRPGPMKADMIRPFLNRRAELEAVDYGHPSLKPILKETKGVIVYHEQVMRVIAELTGCSMGEADRIRRSLEGAFEYASQEITVEKADPLRTDVIKRAVERGWDGKLAEKIWDEVLSFASFGFCKAHAAAFAVPTYQSAWLKAHYPAAFYSGVLTHDPGMYPRRAILADARAHEIQILGVDVNLSHSDYRTEESGGQLAIRLGLQDVKGINEAEISSIIAGRPWRSFNDFCLRAEVARPVVEGLVHCGAFDAIKGGRSRRELYWTVEQEWSSREQARSDQPSLDLAVAEQITLPGIADYSDREKVKAELEVIGMDASRHLMSFYLEELEALGWTRASDLVRKKGRSQVLVAGVKVATQTPPVKSGKRVIFLTLEDGTGQADVTFFEEAQKKYARRVFDGWILAVRGTVRRTGARGVSILAEEVIDLKGDDDLPKLWYSSGGSAGR
ncbi:MAG TPA: DNA polymerase III subunit alpha [Actinomycetota bacterium]|nr:DNA polymerase III subunit alpha [Actinomycetota bacterium]